MQVLRSPPLPPEGAEGSTNLQSPPPEPSPLRFTVGRWLVDTSLDEVEGGGRTVKLEPRAMRLLAALARTPGELVGTEMLLDLVWPGLVVTPGSLYEAVAQLRKVLGPEHVATVARKGYRLIAPVQRADAATRPAPVASAPPLRLGDRSVAVLPFRSRQLPDSHVFIRESLADDLIAELSRQSGLVVVARGTMLGYAGRENAPQQVSAELGVRYVVDGLIELRGDQLHISVQVVDAAVHTQTWADAVDVALASWPETGHLLAARLVRALNLELLDLLARDHPPADPSVRSSADSTRLQALGLASRAWLELIARPETQTVNERASAWAHEAFALAPQIALASTALAFCDWRAASFGWVELPRTELLSRALAHVERAIGLAPRDPDGYYVLSLIAYSSREPARAEEALRHCLRLSSSYAPAYGLLALIRTRRGHPEEAAALCDRAFALSPREPLRVVWHLSKAWAALALNDDRAALEESQRGMAVNPDFATCYITGAAAAQRLGETALAQVWVAFLRERTMFRSVSALHARLPPPGEPAHTAQMSVVARLLREAGLPGD